MSTLRRNYRIVKLFAGVFFLIIAGNIALAQTVNWADSFDDGDISDWTIDNPLKPATKQITLELSTSQYVSPYHSLNISGADANDYGGQATGPSLPVDFDKPFVMGFKFRYNSFHWYHLVQFGPVLLTMDQPGIRLRYRNDSTWGYLGTQSFESYCPPNQWREFRIEVNPPTESYDVYVDDSFKGTANYNGWNSGCHGFRLRDCPHDASDYNYVNGGYYDDLYISGELFDPIVDIKCNDCDCRVHVPTGENAKIDYEIIAGTAADVPVDVWIICITPFPGPLHFLGYDGKGYIDGWWPAPDSFVRPLYSGPLKDMKGTCLDRRIPLGAYNAVLAVDIICNGILDPTALLIRDDVDFHCSPLHDCVTD